MDLRTETVFKFMTNTNPIPQKSPQETEIDHLLAEEFHCDPVFAARFAAACGLKFDTFRVTHVIPEPSLGGDGYGDLQVEAEGDGRRTALLIEDKITAAAATRQAERYEAYAKRLLQDGWGIVMTVLVAPRTYQGERDRYAASIDLEDIAEMLRSPNQRRLDYRRGIIERALRKKRSTGVQNPDPAMHRLHSAYLNWFGERCNDIVLSFRFPELKANYYDGNNWIEIQHPDFPDNVWLRHQLWTSKKNRTGMVDLIVSPASASERSRLENSAPDWAVPPASYGKRGQGVKLSVRVPEMRQSSGFCETIAAKAFAAMERLTGFFLGLETE